MNRPQNKIGPTAYNIAAQWQVENDRLETLIEQLQALTVYRFDNDTRTGEAAWWTLMNRLIGRLITVQESLEYGQSLLAGSSKGKRQEAHNG